MASKIDFGKYPKIIKIEDNGDIIALDKHGRVNTEFNINGINSEKAYERFGTSFDKLHDNYINENLSRYGKNKQSYRDQDDTGKLKSYDGRYNLNEDDLFNPNKEKKSKKWLYITLGIVAVVVIIFLATSYFNNKLEEKKKQEEQTSANQQLQQENQQLQQDMKDTQNKLADSQTDNQQTQQEINNLQNKVDNLKNNQQENTDQGAINSYQDGIDKLQDAQNSKAAGNYEEVKEKVKGLDKYIDKEKLTEDGKNAWTDFKDWLNENNPL